MARNFIDYHCHLLPALDDGSIDSDQSLEMARILADFGFFAVHCTSHRITGCYDNSPATIVSAVSSLQRMLDEQGVALKLIAGTEHYLDEFLVDQLAGALTVAGSRHLLVEVPFRCGPGILPAMVTAIASRGLTPLFAHPERCAAFEPELKGQGFRAAIPFLRKPPKKVDLNDSLIGRLRQSGCRFQGNLGSFAGVYGSEVKQRALLFLEQGVYCCLGSDAHRPEHLAAMLSAGLQAVEAVVGEPGALRLLSGAGLEGPKGV
jgi:protein-tyrosine phosphatase